MIDALAQLYSTHSIWLGWLALLSIALFIISIALIPYLIIRIPTDYFSSPSKSHSSQSKWLWIIRNLFGCILILAGITMLVLPGQGLLTILIGLFISDFPGKYQLEYYLIRQPAILKSINWIRRRNNVAEFNIEQDSSG